MLLSQLAELDSTSMFCLEATSAPSWGVVLHTVRMVLYGTRHACKHKWMTQRWEPTCLPLWDPLLLPGLSPLALLACLSVAA